MVSFLFFVAVAVAVGLGLGEGRNGVVDEGEVGGEAGVAEPPSLRVLSTRR